MQVRRFAAPNEATKFFQLNLTVADSDGTSTSIGCSTLPLARRRAIGKKFLSSSGLDTELI